MQEGSYKGERRCAGRTPRQGNAQCLDEYPLGKKRMYKKYTLIKQYAKRLKASDESYQEGRNNHTHKTMRKKQKKNNKKKIQTFSSSSLQTN